MGIQVISRDGQPEYAVVPWEQYQALLKAAGQDHRMIIYPPMAVTAINCSSRWAPTGRT